ncbi:MAG: hypothetical protein L6Q97_01210 [Thermoanaerobaculia bacterium]|nr:hypothetical protein [Thermoanaerobaculia bacterium]
MIKQLISGIATLMFVQCSPQDSGTAVPSDSRLRTIILDNANLVQLYLPATMDSVAKWDADCCTGGLYTTAFWDNRYPFIKTKHGLCFPHSLPDSICQMTVSWRAYRKKEDWDDMQHLIKYKNHMESIQYDAFGRRVNWILAEIRLLKRQKVGIFAFKDFIHYSWVKPEGQPCETLLLTTFLNGKVIDIWFECSGSQCTGFIERMMPYAEAIRFY